VKSTRASVGNPSPTTLTMVTLETAGGPLQSPTASLKPHEPANSCTKPPFVILKAIPTQRRIVRACNHPGTQRPVARYSAFTHPPHFPAKPTMIINNNSPTPSPTPLPPLNSTSHQRIVRSSSDCARPSVTSNYCNMRSSGQATTAPTSTTTTTTTYISSTKNTKKSEKEPISFTPTTAITTTVDTSPTNTYVTPALPLALPTHPTLDSLTMHTSTQQYRNLHPRRLIVRNHHRPKTSTGVLVPAAQTTDPSSHPPISLSTTTNSRATTIEHKANNPHDPTMTSDTRPIIMIPESPRLPFISTTNNTGLTPVHPPSLPDTNIIKLPFESPASPTSHQHSPVLAGLNKLQQQIEAMQATIQACLNKLQNNCLDPTLQDHTQKHPPHDPSSNKPTHPPLPDPIRLIDFSMFGRPKNPLPIQYTGLPHPHLEQTHVTSIHIHTEFLPTGTFIDSSRRLWNQPTNDRVQPVYMSTYDQWYHQHLLTAPPFPQTMSEYLKFYPPERMNNDRPLKQLRATLPLPRHRSNFYPERLVVGTCHLHKSIYGDLTGPTFTYYLTDPHVLRDKPM